MKANAISLVTCFLLAAIAVFMIGANGDPGEDVGRYDLVSGQYTRRVGAGNMIISQFSTFKIDTVTGRVWIYNRTAEDEELGEEEKGYFTEIELGEPE